GDTTNGDIYVNGLASADTANLAGGVELNVTAHVSGSSGQIHFRGGGSTFDSLTAQAVNGINIDADLTTTQGDLVLEGDSDNTADPTKPDINTLAFADGVTLNSAGNLTLDSTTQGLSAAGSLNLTAAQGLTVNDALTSAGNLTLTAAQGLTLNRDVTSGGSLTLEADSDNTGSSSDKLTLGSGVSLTTTGGGLTLNATSGGIEGLGAATLTSSQGLSVEDPFTAAGALTLSAANGLIVNADVTASGHLFLEGDRGDVSQGTDSITFASGLTLASTGGMVSLDATHGGLSAPAALTVNAAEGIVVNDSLTTGGNTVFDADTDDDGSGTLTVVSGKTVSTGNNALSLTADDIVLDGALDSGTAAISLAVSDGESMGLGLASGFGMNLSAAELASLTETGLTLSGGNITVAAGQTVGSSGKLTIGSSGTTIAGQGALTLQGEDGLAIRSSVTAAGDLTLDGDADNAADGDDRLTLASGVSLTSTAGRVSLDATQGSLSAAGGLTMSATNGLSILENLTTAGTTTLNADTDGDGTGSFSLASGKTLSTGGNPLALTTADATFAGSLDSGTATTSFEGSQSGNTIGLGDAAGDLSLSSAELGRITAGGLLLGGSTNGGITVDNVAASFDTVTLKATGSGGSVSFSGNASSFNALTVNAENGITVSQTLTTAGTTAFHADSDGDGTGAFTVAAGQGVTTGNNPLSVTAGSLGLNGTLDAGTAEAGLEVSRAGATLGLGSGVTCGGSACDLTLTPTQLAQITSGRLTLGGGTNGGITVDALTAANPVTLTATRSGSGVTFGDTASTFTSLTVNAGSGGVDFGADLTASGTLAVTSVGSITDTGTLAVTGPSSFTATGTDQAIALDSAANSFGGTVTLNTTGTGGHATLVSGGGLSLGTSAIGGNLSVTAGGG
ncbi:MAG: hypothetical protein GWM93_05880, partial [Gemmatimonadetes bacterium]|nr:hypothetical protein [Gemmatimonadota bacterium]NIT66210.1 hypothetical protein [Gemmatimonadota bacterium]NIY34787.1 hypothetical protein [Gemmatimonadota bacterium]